jgi:3-deoxy-D-manno-octulosonic-acid transferase
MSRALYRVVQEAARALVPVLARGDSKVARGLRARRDAHEVLARWGATTRDPRRPTLWLHAPSVGEGLQARAVLEALRARRDDVQTVFTHFSPSAEKLGRAMPADVSGYLPWDLEVPMGRVLDAVRPDLVVFTKTEVWPVLVREADRRGVPAALVAGTLPAEAGRLRWPARGFLSPTWAALELVAAIAQDDAERFVTLGVRADRVTVTGDPGVDSAAQRARAADADASYLAPFHADPRPTVVAGSTWPADDAVLLPALDVVRARVPDVRVVLAPHEPDVTYVAELRARLEDAGWSVATLTDVEASGSARDADAVVVDRVGVLAHLYTVGAVAYVGGGFGNAGLHSVLEPAAARLPVCFGPRHTNARAAGELLAAGGAREARDARGLADALATWLTKGEELHYAAVRAFGYIDAHRGAAARTADLLDQILHRTDGSRRT